MADDTQTAESVTQPDAKFSAFLKSRGLQSPDEAEKAITANRVSYEKKIQPKLDVMHELSAKNLKMNEALANITPVKTPEYRKSPDAPDIEARDPMQALGSVASALAVFGSMRTRAPMTAALNSMAASIEGFRVGDKQRGMNEQKKWQDNMMLAMRFNQDEMQKYHVALQGQNFDIVKAQFGLRAIAAQMNDQQMQIALDTKDWHAVDAMLKARWDLAEKNATLFEKKNEFEERQADRKEAREERQDDRRESRADRRQMHNENLAARTAPGGVGNQTAPETTEDMLKVAGRFGMSPAAFEKAADNFNLNQTLPPTSRSQKNQPLITAIMNRAAEKYPDSNTGVNKTELAGYKTAFTNTVNREAAVHRLTDAVQTLQARSTELVKKLNSQLPGQWANQTINNLSSKYGDNADLAELRNLTFALGREYVAATTMPGSNAQMHTTHADQAEKMLNGNMPPAMFGGALKGINEDIGATEGALQKEEERLRGKMKGINSPTAGRRSGDTKPSEATAGGRTPTEEARYQELLRKQNGSQ